jgi:hypothetical protein
MKKVIAVLLMVPSVAMAEFFTGNDLYARMISNEPMDRVLALGYVMGVSDTHQDTAHCAPDSVTNGQTRDVVKLYLQKNPAVRDFTADILVMVALVEAFPCKQQDKPKKKAA